MLEVENYGLRWRVSQHLFRPMDRTAGGKARGFVKIGKEFRALLPGFHMMLGNADDDPELPTVRFYWHVAVAGAVKLVKCVTGSFNDAGIAFRLKLLREPSLYWRTDAAVLYVPCKTYSAAAPLVAAVWAGIREFLSPGISVFAKRLAPGLGVAENPAPTVSFGQHCTQLVANALASRQVASQKTSRQRVGALVKRLLASGLDPDCPYLLPGSTDVYHPLD